MATLHVHLQDGFEGEPVVVQVDGRVVFDEPAVRSLTQVGLARMFDVEVPDDAGTLAIALPARHRDAVIPIDPADAPHLAISVGADGDIVHTARADPWFYA